MKTLLTLPSVTRADAVPAPLRETGFVLLDGAVDWALVEEAYAAAQKLTDPVTEPHLPDDKEYWHFGRKRAEGSPFARLYAALESAALEILAACGTDAAIGADHKLRVCRYPKPEGDPVPYRAAPHTDITLLTLMPAATVSGLEIQSREGVWSSVEAKPGQLVVNSGEMLELLLGYRATPHRVVWEEPVERYSLPFFVQARSDVLLQSDLTAGAYLKQRLTQLRSTSK